MFESKITLRYPAISICSGLTHKYYESLNKLPRDKHSSLFERVKLTTNYCALTPLNDGQSQSIRDQDKDTAILAKVWGQSYKNF
jgi:hypothetical protein